MESDDYNFLDNLKKTSRYPNLPTDEEINIQKEREFVDKGIPFLKEVKDNDTAKQIAKDNGVRVESSGFVTALEIIIGILIILLLVGAGVGGYLFLTYINDGKFQSVDNSSTICEGSELTCPDVPSCPLCPACSPQINLNCSTFVLTNHS